MSIGNATKLGSALALVVAILLPISSDARHHDSSRRNVTLSPAAVNLAQHDVRLHTAARTLPDESFRRADRRVYNGIRKDRLVPYGNSFVSVNKKHGNVCYKGNSWKRDYKCYGKNKAHRKYAYRAKHRWH